MVLAVSLAVGCMHIALDGRIAPDWDFLVDCLATATVGLAAAVHVQRQLTIKNSDREKLLKQLSAAQTDLERLVSTDALTGLLNRRGFDEALSREKARSARSHSTFCIALMDIDDLKGVNDPRGHGEGDRVIQCAADALSSSIRKTDQAARIGGDEFAVILPECAESVTATLPERVRGLVAEFGVQRSIPTFTVSIGLASSGDGVEDVVERADRLMFGVKAQRGRRAVVHMPEAPTEGAREEQAS
jgi:diguanylate cyclase